MWSILFHILFFTLYTPSAGGRGRPFPHPIFDVGESKKTPCRHNNLMSYTVLFNIEQESNPYAYPVVYLR